MPGVEDRSVEVLAIGAAFGSLACITMMLRCYVRAWVVKCFGWDDASMLFSLAFHLMFSVCMIGGALHGTGRRSKDLTPHQRVVGMKYWWLCEIAYCFASIFCKISICIFLTRIAVRRIHLWILYSVMTLTVLAGLIFLLLLFLQCKPISYFWEQTAYDPGVDPHADPTFGPHVGQCIDMDIVITMIYVYSAFAALCDFTVGILPIFLIRKLNMKHRTKMALAGILGMACIASSAVIIRIPWVKSYADDFLYACVDIAIWSHVETGLGITAGSLATLRPLLRQWLGSRSDPSSGPFQGRSVSRRVGGNHDHPVPLASLDHDAQSRLRGDKLAFTVTTIQSQHDPERTWRGPTSNNSSEEQLTLRRNSASQDGQARDNEVGLSIHRTFEVTQTSVGEREHV